MANVNFATDGIHLLYIISHYLDPGMPPFPAGSPTKGPDQVLDFPAKRTSSICLNSSVIAKRNLSN